MNSRQPNSRHCFVCGIENHFGLRLVFYNSGPGEVSADYCAPEHFQGYPGVVHGGIVAAMLDEAAGRAHMGSEPPRFMFTARLEIRYRRNVPVGQPLRLVGQAGKSEGRKAASHSAIYSQNGELLAEADALLVDVPPDTIDGSNLEALGWRVYADEELPMQAGQP